MKETVFLNNDREMPLLGLGVYKLPDDVQAEAAVTSAISAGYRMIDTASVYKNEESVGRAIAKCGVPRKDLFITSKIWNNAQRLGDVQGAFSRSLDRLKVSYVSDTLAGSRLLFEHLERAGIHSGIWTCFKYRRQ